MTKILCAEKFIDALFLCVCVCMCGSERKCRRRQACVLSIFEVANGCVCVCVCACDLREEDANNDGMGRESCEENILLLCVCLGGEVLC